MAGIPDTPKGGWLLWLLRLLSTQLGERTSVLTSHFLPVDLLIWFRCESPKVSAWPWGKRRRGCGAQWTEQRHQASRPGPKRSPGPGSTDLSTGRAETTAALTFPGLSLSHAKSLLGLAPWREMFLQKPEHVCLQPQDQCSDQDALMGLTGGWGLQERVLASRGPPSPCGSCRRGWVPVSDKNVLFWGQKGRRE